MGGPPLGFGSKGIVERSTPGGMVDIMTLECVQFKLGEQLEDHWKRTPRQRHPSLTAFGSETAVCTVYNRERWLEILRETARIQ